MAAINDDGTLTLRLRMPDGLAESHGKYLVVPNVRFASWHDVVLSALGSNTEYAVYRRKHGEKEARATRFGQAISDRRQLPNWSHDKPDDICHPREAGRRSSRSLAGGSQAYRYATTLRF